MMHLNYRADSTGIQSTSDSLVQVAQPVRDSLKTTSKDTLSTAGETTGIRDTLQPVVSSTPVVAVPGEPTIETLQPARQVTETRTESHPEAKTDSMKITPKEAIEPFKIFHNGDQKISQKPTKIWTESVSDLISGQPRFSLLSSGSSALNWSLFIGIISVLFLIYLKIYYQKLLTKVVNTLVNFQLADNMLREKNSIVRRAFLMMNINFIMIISLFILLIARLYGISYYTNSFKDYLLITGIVTGIALVRLVLNYLVGYIFEWIPAIQAQLHTTYLINKNLGLVLLPVVFIAIYTTPVYSKLVILIGAGLLILANIFRIIRGFQIIIKNGILLFYAILYLCTLELLPIVLGSKFIISLR